MNTLVSRAGIFSTALRLAVIALLAAAVLAGCTIQRGDDDDGADDDSAGDDDTGDDDSGDDDDQEPEPDTTVVVFPDTPLGETGDHLYGSGTEIGHDLGVEGVADKVAQTGTTMIRFGGILSEYYDWESNNYEGLVKIDHEGQMVAFDPGFSVDEMLGFCEQVGAEPMLGVNTQLNDPGKAARLVQYCNGETSTIMGSIRAARGHPEPYNVKFWSLGNETDIAGAYIEPFGMVMYNHFGIPFNQWSVLDQSFVTPPQFAALVASHVPLMRSLSPIPLKIVGISLAGNAEWGSYIVQTVGDFFDLLDFHYYPVGQWASYEEMLAVPDTGSDLLPPLEDYVEVFRAVLGDRPWIRLMLGEYNTGVFLPWDNIWWEYLNGLFVADVLGHLSRTRIAVANVYSIASGNPEEYAGYGLVRGDAVSLRASGHVFSMLAGRFLGQSVDCESSSFENGRGLECHAVKRSDQRYAVLIINKEAGTDHTVEVRIPEYDGGPEASVYLIENDAPIEPPQNGTTGVQESVVSVSGQGPVAAFPAYSVGLVIW